MLYSASFLPYIYFKPVISAAHHWHYGTNIITLSSNIVPNFDHFIFNRETTPCRPYTLGIWYQYNYHLLLIWPGQFFMHVFLSFTLFCFVVCFFFFLCIFSLAYTHILTYSLITSKHLMLSHSYTQHFFCSPFEHTHTHPFHPHITILNISFDKQYFFHFSYCTLSWVRKLQ